MGKRLKPQHIDIKEYRAKICMDNILLFLAQHDTKDETKDEDDILLSYYTMQQYWDWIQKDIISI